MANGPAILPPSSLGEAVRSIGLMSDEEFSKILAVISSPSSFSPTKEELSSLEKAIPSLSANLSFLLATLSYLSSQADRFEESGQPFDAVFKSLFDELDKDAKWGDAKELASKRLREILDRREARRLLKKVNRLQSGFLPNATGFSSFVDVRPNFDDTTKEVVGLLPMVQMRITTDADVAADREVIFQISENGLKSLKEAIESIELKIRTLKASNYLSVKRQA